MEIKENRYELCYENLCKKLSEYDPEEIAQRSKAHYDHEKKQFTLTYFNREYLISYPEGSIMLKEDKEKSLIKDSNDRVIGKILIISYLNRATNSILTNKWVPFRELDGVGHAYNHFAQAGIDKLVEFFGHKGELFIKAGFKLGGKKINLADMGIEVDVLPNVPVKLGLWLADDELGADAVILYDYSATRHLHVEDLASLGSVIADELIRAAKEIK